MSTDIFHSDDIKHKGPNPFARLSPLQLYLVVSLPLTLMTLVIWAVLHWLGKHREELKAQAHRFESIFKV